MKYPYLLFDADNTLFNFDRANQEAFHAVCRQFNIPDNDETFQLYERCNNEISKLILGNTLTTESSENGTQALGTVHKKVEDRVAQADRRYILDVLNYDMTDIFQRMGINTAGGKFCFPEQKDIDPSTKMNILTQLRSNFQLPVSDEYLYEEFGIEKPDNYDQLKAEQQQKKEALASLPGQQFPTDDDDDDNDDDPNDSEGKGSNTPEPSPKQKKSFKNWLRSFFAKAPQHVGADLEW